MAHNRFSFRAQRMLNMNEDSVDESVIFSSCLNNNHNDSMSNSKETLLEQSLKKEIRYEDYNNSTSNGDFGSSSSDEYKPGSGGYSSDSSFNSIKESVLRSKGKPPRRISASEEDNDLNNIPEEPNSCNDIEPTCSRNSCNPVEGNTECNTSPKQHISGELNNVSEELNLCNDAGPDYSFWDDKTVNRDGRKRKLRDAKKERRCERDARKNSRNKGEEYLTKTGKLKKRKELKELPDCRAKCKEKIPKQVLENVFSEYWHLGSYEKRANYISNFIIIEKKKVSKIDPKKNREYSNKYVLKFDNSIFNICKKCFLTTFDESNRFIQTICEKKIKRGNVTSSERGRAASYKINR